MISIDYDKIIELDQTHTPLDEYKDKIHSYGTAGFRTHNGALDKVWYRVGLVTAIRASQTGAAGVMITASHNPMQDNGVKIIDKDGSMVQMSWESIFVDIVNSTDLKKDLQTLLDDKNIAQNLESKVMVAWDTRDSSPRLIKALKNGIEAMGITVIDFGVMTTPQLHFLIWYGDRQGDLNSLKEDDYYKYYETNLQEYWKLINKESTQYQNYMIVDASDGVGGIQVKKLDFISNQSYYNTQINVINDTTGDLVSLNENCGAENIHKEKVFSKGSKEVTHDDTTKWISFDGDADRIVYYYGNVDTNDIHIVDGDKIAILLGDYIQSMINEISNENHSLSDLITFAVVQTGYANSSATKYLVAKGVHVESTPTGVKYLHHRAQGFDIGVYFEANGHGTIITKYDKIVEVLTTNGFTLDDSKVEKFLKFLKLTNEAVGDAMSVMIMMEALLKDKDMSIQQADQVYTDLPSRMLKVPVADRSKFVTEAENETILVHPSGLQEDILEACSSFSSSRSFVRPSGTEDVVRIYAEGETQADADALAQKVKEIVETKYVS